MYATVVVKYN